MIEQNNDQRHLQRIYEKFRDSVLSGNLPRQFIDEDDLIDIYDYAGDNGDEYVQLMTIACAMNQCPDNPDMIQRRAYFFTQNLGLTESGIALMNGHKHESALWDLLALLVERPEPEKAVEAIDKIVRSFNEYDDETIIQLVSVCAQLGLLRWLKENKKLVQGRCMYADTFLYEFARALSEDSDHNGAIALLDELTGIEPFNVLYWQLLADEYNQIEDFDNALSAIDYALAIDGTNRELQLVRAQILYDHNSDKEQAIAIARELLKADSNNIDAANILTVMLSFSNRADEAIKVIEPFVERYPYNRSVVANALVAGNRALNEKALDGYMKADATLTEADVTAWAAEQADLQRYSTAADILLAWFRLHGSLSSCSLLLTVLYKSRRYADITVFHNEMLKILPGVPMSCTLTDLLLIAFSYVRIGSPKTAIDICKFIESVDVRDAETFFQRVETIGAHSLAIVLRDAVVRGDDNETLDRLDPFTGSTGE